VPGQPSPDPATTQESVSLSNLTPDRDYCFLLRVTDDSAHEVFSNVLKPHTSDLIPPDEPTLSSGTITDTSVVLQWTAVGDNVDTGGPVAFQELRYQSGAGCETFGSGNFSSGIVYPTEIGRAHV